MQWKRKSSGNLSALLYSCFFSAFFFMKFEFSWTSFQENMQSSSFLHDSNISKCKIHIECMQAKCITDGFFGKRGWEGKAWKFECIWLYEWNILFNKKHNIVHNTFLQFFHVISCNFQLYLYINFVINKYYLLPRNSLTDAKKSFNEQNF